MTMDDEILILAARSGLTETALVDVLTNVLQQVAGDDMSKADAVMTIVKKEIVMRTAPNALSNKRGEGNMENTERPEIGDVAHMHGEEVQIKITDVIAETDDGDWRIIDQYGETHIVTREDEELMVLVPAL